MGTWDIGAFDDDSGMDWAEVFVEAPEGLGSDDEPGKLSLVMGCIDIAATEDPVEFLDAVNAVCAAEVLAAALGKGCEVIFPPQAKLDEEKEEGGFATTLAAIGAWSKSKEAQRLRQRRFQDLAVKALERVLGTSELAALWDDSPDKLRWKAGMRGLISRVS